MFAKVVAPNIRDKTRFESLFDTWPSTTHPPIPRSPAATKPTPVPGDPSSTPSVVDVRDADRGQLGALQKHQLVMVLSVFIEDGVFPIDPKRVPACIDGKLELPLIIEFCTPFAAKQRRFSPQERVMIRAEI